MVSTLVCAALLTLAPAGARASTASEADLLAARDAMQKGDWKTLAQLRGRFAGHLLEAYPGYWLLAGNLERSDPVEVEAFLGKYRGTVLAETLRRQWLKVLGAAGAWDLFRLEHPRLLSDDVEITCYAFQERLVRLDPEAMPEAHALFVAGREAPASCDPVFAALVDAGQATEEETWERIRKLLAAGLVRDARRANALLPQRMRMDEKALESAAAKPAAFLAREKSPVLSRAARTLTVFAIARLARSDSEAAADRLPAFEARLGREAAGHAWAELAWQGALNLDLHALEWYGRAGATALTPSQVAWKARAALRAGDWRAVLAAIQDLPPEEAREAEWRYWRARALKTLGAGDAAQRLLQGLAGQMNFYGLLAADDLGIAVVPGWEGIRAAPADLARVGAMEGVRRALELYRIDLPAEGLREWSWAMRGLDDRGLIAAAQLASDANVPDRAINAAERTVQLHDYARRFPTPHQDALGAAARQWGLDEAMLYALIRQESRFMAEARSSAGAMGLMQLMPSTARWVARQIPVRPFQTAMLSTPEVNVNMGTYYFGRVLADLGNPILATAAYNAGPGRARRWRALQPLEGAVYIETIPFGETRDYVKKVFTNAWFYRDRLTGRAASFRQILGTVPGRADDTSVASTIP